MEIFWGSGSGPAWRVLLAAKIKKAPYESRLLSFSKLEHRSPAMLAMNPRGKVPVLKDGDFTLYESLAMLAYLDEKFPEPPLFGKTPQERAITWRKVMEAESYVHDALRKVSRPLLFEDLPAKEAEVRAGVPGMHEELAKIEASLQSTPWIGGAQVSAADLVVFPLVMALLRAANKPIAAPFDLRLLPLEKHYPSMAAWKARVEAIEGYEATYPPHWRDG